MSRFAWLSSLTALQALLRLVLASLPVGERRWNECAGDHFAGASTVINSLKRLGKPRLKQRCEAEVPGQCDGAKDDMIDAMITNGKESFVGPELPEGGIRICHKGLAIGFDSPRRNPAWVAYRLRKSEQQNTDNKRRGFYPDASIPEINQTLDKDYTNTGYDRGHLAPSLAMSFDQSSQGPWESCYACTNIAPQAASTNRNGWESFEGVIRDYAEDKNNEYGHSANHDVFLITGLGYWNRKTPLTHGALVVPSFYWTVACDMQAKSSFAIIADNDAYFSDPWSGWPPSLFKKYSVAEVEKYFDLKLGLPEECAPTQVNVFIKDGKYPPKKKERPQPLPLEVYSPDQPHIAYGETLVLHFKLPFDGDLPDSGGVLKLKAPEPPPQVASQLKDANFHFDCDALLASDFSQLPHGFGCDNSIAGTLSLGWSQGPIKGGAFLLNVVTTMPRYRPLGNWTASLLSAGQPVATIEAVPFELVIRADSDVDRPGAGAGVSGSGGSASKPGSGSASKSKFWYFSAGAIIIIVLTLLVGIVLAFPSGMLYARRRARQLARSPAIAETQLEQINLYPSQWNSKPILAASPQKCSDRLREAHYSRGGLQNSPAPMKNLW